MKKLKKNTLLEVDYRRDGLPFTALVEKIESENIAFIDVQYLNQIKLIEEGLNIIYSMASQFSWLFVNQHIAYLNKANTVLFSTTHKNLIALHASLKLTKRGLYGPARSALRHVYEALLIAKFCSISHDISIYEKWKEGNVVYLANGVLKKITIPDIEPFTEFWAMMSEYTHATIYSQQIALNVRSVPNEVPLNLVYLRILLECQYHLVNRHLITSSMIYYTKRYHKEPDPLPELKREMRGLLKESRTTLLDRPKEIIRAYCANWHICS